MRGKQPELIDQAEGAPQPPQNDLGALAAALASKATPPDGMEEVLTRQAMAEPVSPAEPQAPAVDFLLALQEHCRDKALELTPEYWRAYLQRQSVPVDGGNARSPEIRNFALAMSRAQGQIRAATKDKTASVQTKTGGSYTYHYADLAGVVEACRQPLLEHELALLQLPKIAGAYAGVVTLIIHGASGEWVQSELLLPCSAVDPKNIGACLSYARRYSLCAMVGVVTPDEDDETALAVAQAKEDVKKKRQSADPDGAGYQHIKTSQARAKDGGKVKPSKAAPPTEEQQQIMGAVPGPAPADEVKRIRGQIWALAQQIRPDDPQGYMASITGGASLRDASLGQCQLWLPRVESDHKEKQGKA